MFAPVRSFLMLRVFGCLMIVISASLGGIYFSSKLKNRVEFLKDFISFLKSLKIQLRYTSSDIFTILPMCTDSKVLKPLFYKMTDFKDKNSLSEIWNNSLLELTKPYGLSKSDTNAITDFGLNLGKTDTDGQLSHIDLYIEIFTKAYENAVEEMKTKSRLYKTMGFFIGTSIALMIV